MFKSYLYMRVVAFLAGFEWESGGVVPKHSKRYKQDKEESKKSEDDKDDKTIDLGGVYQKVIGIRACVQRPEFRLANSGPKDFVKSTKVW